MSTMSTVPLPLVANDIAAMRIAEQVWFRRDSDGTSRIKLILPDPMIGDQQRIYTSRQQQLFPDATAQGGRHRSIAAASSLTYYTDQGELLSKYTEHAQCRYEINYALDRSEWQTINRVARQGDVVSLRWKAGNDSPAIAKAGLHRDELRLMLNRQKNSPVFLLDALVCADNTARMIRL